MCGDTQYPSKIPNGFCGVHKCVALKTLQTFFLSDQLDEGEHSKFLVFQYGSCSSLLSPQEEFHKNACLNLKDKIMIFPTDRAPCTSSLGMLHGVIPFTSTWIWVQNGGPKFHVP